MKAANAIRQVVSMAILTELKDPRVKNVTVTSVEVSPDMRQARINVSIMGDEKTQNLTLKGLRNAAGFLQSKIADGIDTRYTPRLEFRLDSGVKNALAVARILDEVLPKERAAADPDSNQRTAAEPVASAEEENDDFDDGDFDDDADPDDDEE